MSTGYHHGDLAAELRGATAELVAEKGPSGFSLREVARRAGVSHAAPAHHFGDAEGMLTSVAAEGFGLLADEMESAAAGVDDAGERLLETARAYVKAAVERPGHFLVMMQPDLVSASDQRLSEQRARAHTVLERVVIMIRDQYNPGLDVGAASTFCLAAFRGLAATPTESTVEQFAHFMINGFAKR